jgi:hypothetical protein
VSWTAVRAPPIHSIPTVSRNPKIKQPSNQYTQKTKANASKRTPTKSRPTAKISSNSYNTPKPSDKKYAKNWKRAKS